MPSDRSAFRDGRGMGESPPRASMPTETTLLVPVPEVEPVVRSWRGRFDPAAGYGVPAHITLLYPFLPPDLIDAGVMGRLRTLFGRAQPFAFSLVEPRRFGEKVLYLAPSPDEPFRRLTTSLVEEFPECPAYAGAFDGVVPHLTIVDGAGVDILEEVQGSVISSLPVASIAAEAWLMTGRAEAGAWTLTERFALGE
jgi:hypothetical protein